MELLFFIISFISSTIGAICGIGGGVIIKPVLDAANVLPVATISFLSGCTVLTMAVVSLLRQKNSGVKLDIKRTTYLAIGASVGGIIGKYIFDLLKSTTNENMLGGIQATILLIITADVLVFIIYKNKIKMLNVQSSIISLSVGLGLGLISAFLGIGGGPINIVVLYFFFSMDPKTSALNSIYVIMFSQTASLISSIVTKSVPQFSWIVLILMMAGGVSGALVGSAISKKIENSKVEFCFKIMLIVIMAINAYNIVKFF